MNHNLNKNIMRKFNLEEMKSGIKVIARDGRTVTLVKYDHRDKTYPLCICIDGELMYHWYSLDGISANSNNLDLFMED